MLKLTKFQAKEFKKLAKILPTTYYEVKQKRTMIGKDIIDNPNINKSVFGVVHPDQKYIVENSVRYPVNHNNRIINAYKNGGMKAVEEYCKLTQELVLQELTPINGLTVVE